MQKRKERGLYNVSDDPHDFPRGSLTQERELGGAADNPAYAEEKSRLWLVNVFIL